MLASVEFIESYTTQGNSPKTQKWPRGHCCEALICIKGVLGIYLGYRGG